MPVCCRCNASRRCRNCSCKKSAQRCVNCLPYRHAHCENAPVGHPEDHSSSNNSSFNPQPTEAERISVQQVISLISAPLTSPSSPSPSSLSPSSLSLSSSSPSSPSPSSPLLTTRVDSHETLYSLPDYPPLLNLNFMWGNLDGISFTNAIHNAHKEVVHWRRNIFKVPSGRVGKSFVSELAHLCQILMSPAKK